MKALFAGLKSWFVMVALVALAAPASAQVTTIPQFDFDFSNPGARSLGFGGAFAALADDATAAYANPAGLTQLTRREVSLELRAWEQTPTFIAGGRDGGMPTGIGLDTRRGLDLRQGDDTAVAPSFAALVIPKGRASFALYGHQVAKFDVGVETQGFFFDLEPGEFPVLGISPQPGVGRVLATRERVDLEVRTAGAAMGWRITEALSLGLGVALADVALTTSTTAFGPDNESVAAGFDEFSFLPESQVLEAEAAIDDTDVVFNLGARWQVSERLSAAAFFRRGATAAGSTRTAFRFFDDEVFATELDSEFRVPDLYGFGLAYRAADGRLTLALEVDRVGYEGLFELRTADGEDATGVTYEDAWELHLGAEWAFLAREPLLAVRAGVWMESDDDGFRQDDILHWAAGIGWAARRFQVDLGIDLSDEVNTASMSLIYSF